MWHGMSSGWRGGLAVLLIDCWATKQCVTEQTNAPCIRTCRYTHYTAKACAKCVGDRYAHCTYKFPHQWLTIPRDAIAKNTAMLSVCPSVGFCQPWRKRTPWQVHIEIAIITRAIRNYSLLLCTFIKSLIGIEFVTSRLPVAQPLWVSWMSGRPNNLGWGVQHRKILVYLLTCKWSSSSVNLFNTTVSIQPKVFFTSEYTETLWRPGSARTHWESS